MSRSQPSRKDDLTKSQAKVISDALYPGVNYLVRLRTKMQKAGFPHKDKLYELVCAAYDASWLLSHELHYRSCDGVYRESKPPTPAAATMPECDAPSSSASP